MGDIGSIWRASAIAHLPSSQSTDSFWHNEPSQYLIHHRTTADLPATADVVIIGSGISGAFAARKFREGFDGTVLMLEAREACWGATGRNGGHCLPVFYHGTPDVADFQLRNFKALSALIEENAISCEWKQMDGNCYAFFSDRLFQDAKTKALELHERYPQMAEHVSIVEDKEELAKLRIPNSVGAFLQTTAAKLAPYKLVSWILEDLVRSSALNLQTCTPVLGLSQGPGCSWTVQTSRGFVQAPHVLLATNAYTTHLLPQLESLIVPVRGQMSAISAPEQLRKTVLQYTYGFISERSPHDDYLIQRPTLCGGQLMFGGGRALAENAGVNMDNDNVIDKPVAQYLRSVLPSLLDLGRIEKDASSENPFKQHDVRNSDPETINEWSGILGFSRDGNPWVGAIPSKPGIWISAGFTGHGMPNAALCAQHVAELIKSSIWSKDRRDTLENAISATPIPKSYCISQERMERAHMMPDIRLREISKHQLWQA